MTLSWKEIEIGCIVTEPGSASDHRTGDWRADRPEYDFSKCIKCGICYIYCPEGCIYQNDDGYFLADMYYCKGCGICANECPAKCIAMKTEEKE